MSGMKNGLSVDQLLEKLMLHHQNEIPELWGNLLIFLSSMILFNFQANIFFIFFFLYETYQ